MTSLPTDGWEPRYLYERTYCARGDMENRIKEQQLGLFADRTSTATMHANQLRLYFSSVAYILMHALRRLGLQGTARNYEDFAPLRPVFIESFEKSGLKPPALTDYQRNPSL